MDNYLHSLSLAEYLIYGVYTLDVDYSFTGRLFYLPSDLLFGYLKDDFELSVLVGRTTVDKLSFFKFNSKFRRLDKFFLKQVSPDVYKGAFKGFNLNEENQVKLFSNSLLLEDNSETYGSYELSSLVVDLLLDSEKIVNQYSALNLDGAMELNMLKR